MKNSKNQGKVVVENVNVPGYTHSVDAEKYIATKTALLKILPKSPPGITQAEMFAAIVRHLPGNLFPGGSKAEWWTKTVQLDLEAKRLVGGASTTKPLRWFRTR